MAKLIKKMVKHPLTKESTLLWLRSGVLLNKGYFKMMADYMSMSSYGFMVNMSWILWNLASFSPVELVNAFVIIPTHCHLILFDKDFDQERLRKTVGSGAA